MQFSSLQDLLSRSITQNLGIADLLKKREAEAQQAASTQMAISDMEARNIEKAGQYEAQAIMDQEQNRRGLWGTAGSLAGGFVGGSLGGPMGAAIGSAAGGALGSGGMKGLAEATPSIIGKAAASYMDQEFKKEAVYKDMAEKGFAPTSQGDTPEFSIPIGGSQTGFKRLLKTNEKSIDPQARSLYAGILGIPETQVPSTMDQITPLIDQKNKSAPPKPESMLKNFNDIITSYGTDQKIPESLRKTYESTYGGVEGYQPLPDTGYKKPAPVAGTGTGADRKESIEIGKILNKGVEDLKADKNFQTYQGQLDAASNIREIINSGNPLANNAFPTLLRKLFGDTGNVAVAEQKSIQYFGGSVDKAKQFATNLKSGKIDEKNVQLLNQMLGEFETTAAQNLTKAIDSKKVSMKQAFKGVIDPEAVGGTFNPLYPKKVAQKNTLQEDVPIGTKKQIKDKKTGKVVTATRTKAGWKY